MMHPSAVAGPLENKKFLFSYLPAQKRPKMPEGQGSGPQPQAAGAPGEEQERAAVEKFLKELVGVVESTVKEKGLVALLLWRSSGDILATFDIVPRPPDEVMDELHKSFGNTLTHIFTADVVDEATSTWKYVDVISVGRLAIVIVSNTELRQPGELDSFIFSAVKPLTEKASGVTVDFAKRAISAAVGPVTFTYTAHDPTYFVALLRALLVEDEGRRVRYVEESPEGITVRFYDMTLNELEELAKFYSVCEDEEDYYRYS